MQGSDTVQVYISEFFLIQLQGGKKQFYIESLDTFDYMKNVATH